MPWGSCLAHIVAGGIIVVVDLEMVVCTHQRASLLERLLESVLAAERPGTVRLGMTVVANGCTDDTVSVARRMGERFRHQGADLRVVEEPRLGKSYALNRALGLVEGDYLVFVDDDHRLDPAFFRALADGMDSHPGESLYCGRVLPDWTGDEPAWVREDGRWAIRPPPVPCQDWGDESQMLDGSGRVPGGGNLVVERDFARSLGAFKTDLGPQGHDLFGGEDGEWLARSLERGTTIRYLPRVIQYHYVDPARLKLRYLIEKAYLRSKISTGLLGGSAGSVPLYQYRKILNHLIGALISLRMTPRRYHLVRLAAVLGEYAAMRKKQYVCLTEEGK